MIVIGLLLSLSGCDDDDSNDCGDVAYYGPAPCQTDDDCEETNGPGWYCDEDATVGEPGCESVWPMCVFGDDESDGGEG